MATDFKPIPFPLLDVQNLVDAYAVFSADLLHKPTSVLRLSSDTSLSEGGEFAEFRFQALVFLVLFHRSTSSNK